MKAEVKIPVTVKHRIGVDDLDQYEDMLNFVDIVSQAKADRFSVHARKAWLQGLNPKENREIPPLRYDEVYELKRVRPDLEIEINGGIKTIESMASHLGHVDAVMIGRAVYENPWLFHDVDTLWYGAESAPLSHATRSGRTHDPVYRRACPSGRKRVSCLAAYAGTLRGAASWKVVATVHQRTVHRGKRGPRDLARGDRWDAWKHCCLRDDHL